MIDRSFVRFVLVGLANSALGYGVILALHYGFGLAPAVANVGGYLIGAMLSYALNRTFTFASNAPHGAALPRFCVAVVGSFAINLVVLEVGLRFLALPVAVAQAMAVAAYAIAFYFASKVWVFRV